MPVSPVRGSTPINGKVVPSMLPGAPPSMKVPEGAVPCAICVISVVRASVQLLVLLSRYLAYTSISTVSPGITLNDLASPYLSLGIPVRRVA